MCMALACKKILILLHARVVVDLINPEIVKEKENTRFIVIFKLPVIQAA